MDNPVSLSKKRLKLRIFDLQGHEICRCGYSFPFGAWKSRSDLHKGIVEYFKSGRFSTILWRFFPQNFVERKSVLIVISLDPTAFWKNPQIRNTDAVQNAPFPHSFPHAVENYEQTDEQFWKTRGNTVEKYADFHSCFGKAANQFPLISLTISSISARKTGSWAIFFSTVFRELMTVA